MKVRGAVPLLALIAALAAAPAVLAADIEQIIAGIGGPAFQAGVKRIDAIIDVRVVLLSSLDGAGEAHARLEEAVAASPRDIAYMKSSIVLNPSALGALENAGAEIGQVVSVELGRDGGATLFVNDL